MCILFCRRFSFVTASPYHSKDDSVKDYILSCQCVTLSLSFLTCGRWCCRPQADGPRLMMFFLAAIQLPKCSACGTSPQKTLDICRQESAFATESESETESVLSLCDKSNQVKFTPKIALRK